jgi:prepilin-type N-terminal cleavage/methylation domain-containing protein
MGFTLIELLIVVAIIAILAAIAVPNFLEAQTRAKVARVVSDMRSIATGMETYHIDWNRYPFDFADDHAFPYYFHKGMTTPINYISNGARMEDLFSQSQRTDTDRIYHRFRYRAFSEDWLSKPAISGFNLPNKNAPGMRKAISVHGSWFFESKGPDTKTGPLPSGFADGNNVNDWLWQLYDASNGTLSKGDILRAANGDINSRGFDVGVNY